MSEKLPVIKSWVTCLEMTQNPALKDSNIHLDGIIVKREKDLSAQQYLELYKEVGRHYIWNYRPSQTIEKVQEIVSSNETLIYFFYDGQKPIGFSEIDCKNPEDIEIVHFGLINDYIGKGYGNILFKNILKKLWNLSPDRIHLSTCGLDHHKAVDFYQAAGLTIYKKSENVEFEDYRYSDFYDLSDAPQIPLAGEENDR